jgi:hypothetical protein
MRAEFIRFGCYVANTVEFAGPSPIQTKVSLFSDVDVVSLRTQNMTLQCEIGILNARLQKPQSELKAANNDKLIALNLLSSQQSQLTNLAEKSTFEVGINEKIFHEFFSIHDAVKSQSKVLAQTNPSTAYLAMNATVVSEISGIHKLAKMQSQAITELTCNTLEHTGKNQVHFVNIKGQLHNRLDAIDTSIAESMD